MSTALTPRQKAIRRELRRRYLFPCRGYWSSIQRDRAPEGVITGDSTSDSYNWLCSSQEGQLVRRRGMAYYNESDVTAQVGLLESVSKNLGLSFYCRQMLDLQYPSTLPGAISGPTALYTDSTDLSHMGQLYVLTSTQGTRKVLGHEMGTLASPGTTHYPRSSSLTAQNFKMIPLPYICGGASASAGLATQAVAYSRCTFPLQRLLTCGGAMRATQAVGWTLVPDAHGTPMKHNGKSNPSTSTGSEVVRIQPWGHLPPLFPPTAVAGAAATGTNDKLWWDGDQYYLTVLFKRADGSYSAPAQIRSKNSILTNGLGLVTVGSTSGTSAYRYMSYSNIAIGPAGTVARVLCRTRKTNVSTATVRPQGMTAAGATSDIDSGGQKLYVLGVIKNNTQTTYVDTGSSDDQSLVDNAAIIRTDHLWCLPGRYAFDMERRIGVGYVRPQHPCAIILAPTQSGGVSRDLNGVDDTAGNNTATFGGGPAYGIYAYCFRLYKDTSGVLTLQLRRSTAGGAAISTTSITLGSGSVLTVQDVIDSVNATLASATNEWAAQPVPGVDPNILVSNLAPTVLDVAACTVTNGSGTVSVGSSGFAGVAIGMRVKIASGTGTISSTAVVIGKATDGSVQLGDENGNAITATGSGTATLRFWSDTGDDSYSTDTATWDVGNLRCLLGAFPGIAALSGSYVDSFGFNTRDVLMTSASPGSSAMAPESFFNAESNRKQLPAVAGIFMGSAQCGSVQIVCGSEMIYVLKNVKGANTGEDLDYHLFPLSPRGRGCIQYGGVVSGDGWAGYPTREGFVVTDGEREVVISNALYDPANGRGIMADLCATQAATNGIANLPAYQKCHAIVADSTLRLTFPLSATSEIVSFVYDFSKGIEGSGLGEVLDRDGQPFPWSAPQLMRTGAMVKTWDGKLYAANDDNGGATANGTIWQLDTGLYDAVTNARSAVSTTNFTNPSFVAWNDHRAAVYQKYAQSDTYLGAPLYGASGAQAGAATSGGSFSPTYRPRICPDGSGGCIVASIENQGSGVFVYVQRLNSSGVKQWGASGTVVSAASSESPWVCSDGSGGCFVSWYNASNGFMYVQKLNSSGVVQWTAGGVSCAGASTNTPKVFATSDGGCYVTWTLFTPWRQIVQRFDSTGVVYAGWPAGGLDLGDNASNSRHETTTTSLGWIASLEQRSSTSLYVKLVSPAGVLVYTSANLAPGAMVANVFAIVPDNDGGVLVAWMDTASGTRLMVSGVSATGATTLAATVAYTYTSALTTTLNGVSDGRNGIVVIFSDTISATSRVGVCTMNRSGVAAWAAQTLSTIQGVSGCICSDGSNGSISYWLSNSTPSDVRGQRVDSTGAPQWGTNGVVVAASTGDIYSPSCCFTGASDGFAVTSTTAGSTTLTGSITQASSLLTAMTPGDFRRVPIGGKIKGSGITGAATVVNKSAAGDWLTISGTLTGNTTNQPYTCYGQEIECNGYLCTDHLDEVGSLTSAQFATPDYACPTGETMGILHSYDFARTTQAQKDLAATGNANATTHRAPPDQPLVDLASASRSPGVVQEFAVFSRNGSMGNDTLARGEFWGMEAVFRRLNAYV